MQENRMEEWRKIILNDIETEYEASSFGQIRKKENRKILKQYMINSGYLIVVLNSSRFLVHRLILMAFSPTSSKELQVNHIDFNKKNNNIENLEWVSQSENILHSYKNGNHKKAKEVFQYDLKGNFIKRFYSECEASRETGTNQSQISRCCRGIYKTANGFQWSNVEAEKKESQEAKTRKRKVDQFDKDGNFIKTFSSFAEASRETKTDSSCISRACDKNQTANGFVWKSNLG